jgi:tetratricopeptide (TPR) repeat protein
MLAIVMRREAGRKHYVARIALTLAVAGCLQAVSSVAQTPQDWALCLGQDLSSFDFPIQGCTAVIQAGRQMLDRLATAYNNRGVAYRIKGEYDKAIDDFNEAIKLRPSFANAFNNRGVAHRNKGDLNGALADYDQAIRLKPDYAAAFYNRGLVYEEKGEYQRAVDEFTLVLQLAPRDPLVLFRRGEALLKTGNVGAANADIAAARTIKPDIAEAIDRAGR